MVSVFDRVENFVDKGEYAGYQQCFQKASCSESLKDGNCVVKS